jgi:hypothetical protein
VGGEGPAIFTPEAVEKVYGHSRGIPRLINLLCEQALITGFAEQRKPVDAVIIDGVAQDFDLTESVPIGHKPSAALSADSLLAETFEGLATLMDRLKRAE